jgi:hypothetical protein
MRLERRTKPIVFTGEVKAPGYWDGIEVASLATSQINHAIVEYGGPPARLLKPILAS